MTNMTSPRLWPAAAIALAGATLAGPACALADERTDILAAAAWAEPLLGSTCDFSRFRDGDLGGSAIFDIRYRMKGQGQDEPDNVFSLVQLFCSLGAYNASFVYLQKQDDGYRLLAFAEPILDYDYTDENFTALKAPPVVSGFAAKTELVNSDFDPKTRLLSMGVKWRGLGDAWSSGEWEFREGQFVLTRYTIDPTYDLNADNADPESPQSAESWQVYPAVKRNEQ